MCSSSLFPEPAAPALLQHVEPLLLKYKVDVALWGHHHSYQRSCPMLAQGKCVSYGKGGIVHAVIGAAGYEFSPIAAEADKPGWLRFASNTTYGYSRMTANATTLDFVFLRTDTKAIIDGFVLWN